MAGHTWPTPAEYPSFASCHSACHSLTRIGPEMCAPKFQRIIAKDGLEISIKRSQLQSIRAPESDLHKIQGINITRESYHSLEFASKSCRSFEAKPKKFAVYQSEAMPVSSKEVHLENAAYTATDLRSYTKKVGSYCMYGLPSLEGHVNNGKLSPSKYASIGTEDLGQCYETIYTLKSCKHGRACRWRHTFLTEDEREWIQRLGGNCVQ
ncbi:hypothetical protein BKA63DRAFT_592777 [Paraphoma chrysanthemicola]|nr:hypothetical protein BKA63DRAFT_592777 [Paraphoma chrysanthemicola]